MMAPTATVSPVMTSTKLAQMGTENHTPRRTIRIPDSVWDAAQAKAAENGETVSAVVVKALESYVRRK